MEQHVLLLTGPPGIGKTTVVQRVAEHLSGRRLGGFYTQEVRDRGGRRVGFRGMTFTGERRLIAHVDFRGPARVGRYGVDVAAVAALAGSLATDTGVDICLLDEIGKMECLSPAFVGAARGLFDSGVPVVATVAWRGGGLIAEVKARRDVEIWEVEHDNRERLPEDVLGWVGERLDS